MKVEVNEIKKEEKKYPYLGYSPKSGNIVLFIKEEAGIYLSVIKGSYNMGDYENGIEESDFTKFQGSITLSND